jgi:excisionase family DNA binding protein
VPTPATTDRLAYSPRELAELLGVTRQHIHNLIARGEIASVKLGSRRLIHHTTVERLFGEDGDAA